MIYLFQCSFWFLSPAKINDRLFLIYVKQVKSVPCGTVILFFFFSLKKLLVIVNSNGVIERGNKQM